MFATDARRDFKTPAIGWLEGSRRAGLATTRVTATTAPNFPNSSRREWRAWFAIRSSVTTATVPYRARSPLPDPQTLARFVAARDGKLRREAQVAICCSEGVGIGSGINAVRFIHEGKPLDLYAAEAARRRVNLANMLHLEAESPAQVRLAAPAPPRTSSRGSPNGCAGQAVRHTLQCESRLQHGRDGCQ